MENYEWLFTLETQIGIALIGMFSHFLKKQIKGETLVEIKQYFGNHFKSTLLAIIATVFFTVAYYFTLGTGQTADILAALGIGFTSDSAFNKWDKP